MEEVDHRPWRAPMPALFSAELAERMLAQEQDYDVLDRWTREPVSPLGVPEELWGLRFFATLDDDDQLMTQEGVGEPSSSEVPEEFRWLFKFNDGAAAASPGVDAQLLQPPSPQEEEEYGVSELDQWMHEGGEADPWSPEEDYDALDED